MTIDFMINSLPSGGAERVMSILANGLSDKHSVRLITFNEGEAFILVDEVKRIKLHHGFIKNHTVRSIINLHSFYKAKPNRPDVLISFLPENNLIAVLVGKLRGIKVIISEHTNHTAMVDRKTKWIQKYVYRFAFATTVLTSFDKPYFSKFGAKVTIMPNPLKLPESIKEFSKRNHTILAVGALNRYENKGFDSLLKLIAPILEKNLDWSLTIAGHGDKGMQDLMQLTKQLKLEKQVNFTGFCNNIQALMQDSQIFVLPSKYEGLPMGLMEALSNGMACIAYDCVSGPSELIKHNLNGLLIKDQDHISMQQGLISLIENPKLRKKLASNAPASMKPYSLKNILARWEQLF